MDRQDVTGSTLFAPCVYLQEDFTKSGQTYDVIVDTVGKHWFRRCRGSLKPAGIY